MDRLVRLSWHERRVVYTQKLCRFRITTFALIYSDQVEYLVVLAAMHGHSNTDGHLEAQGPKKRRVTL